MTIDRSGLAFPQTSASVDRPGLTRREYYAARAMEGLLAGGLHFENATELAAEAVTCADALIRALEK